MPVDPLSAAISTIGGLILGWGSDSGGQERQSFGAQNVVQPNLQLEQMIRAALGDAATRTQQPIHLPGSPDASGLIGSRGTYAGVDVGLDPGVLPFGAPRQLSGQVGVPSDGTEAQASQLMQLLLGALGGSRGGGGGDRREDPGGPLDNVVISGGGLPRPDPPPHVPSTGGGGGKEPDLGFLPPGSESGGFGNPFITDAFMGEDPRSAFGGGPNPIRTEVTGGFAVGDDFLNPPAPPPEDDGGFFDSLWETAKGYLLPGILSS